jgi:hypothetical protein
VQHHIAIEGSGIHVESLIEVHDADQQTAYEQITVLRVGLLDLGDARAPVTTRFDGHRAHSYIFASGCRGCLTRFGG